MTIKLRHIIAVVAIIAMVAGWKWLDDNGYLSNPLDRVPSVEINQP